MPDFSEVLEQQAEHTNARAPSSHALMALLRESQRGAAVLDELLDSPAWNIFRSNIAGYRQAAQEEFSRLREQSETGAVVGDDRARSDLRLQYLRGQLVAFQIALELPKTLIGKHKSLEKIAATTGGSDDTRGGLDRGQQEPHKLHEAGSTPARATTRLRSKSRATRKRRR